MEIKTLCLAHSLSWTALARGFRSPLAWLLALCGVCGFLVPSAPFPSKSGAWIWFVAAPFVEEFTWRALLQNELEHFWPARKFACISLANFAVSLAFASAHAIAAPGFMACLTFFPSIALGILWSEFHSVWLCGLTHLWYNIALHFQVIKYLQP